MSVSYRSPEVDDAFRYYESRSTVISNRITSEQALTVSLASESCQYALSIPSGEALPVS
jgi:hypothetical protein